MEILSIIVEKVLYWASSDFSYWITDTNHMSNNKDGLSNSDLYPESVRVRFDMINMFPTVENKIGIN